MRNIFTVIKSDIGGLFKSGLIILLSIAVCALPALYAWLNLYACWDPYENLAKVKIAIYTEDEDYTLEDGTVVNMSDELVDDLAEESDIGWTMVDSRDEAIDGVYDGSYYASVIIEKNFTESLFDFDNVEENEPTIAFYQNQKANAIATRMTDSASNTLQRCVSQKYVKALMTTVFGHLNDINDDLGDLESDTDESQSALMQLKTNMESYGDTLEAFVKADKLLMGTLDSTDVMIDDTINGIYETVDNLRQQKNYIEELKVDLHDDVDEATDSLDSLKGNMDELADIMERVGELDTTSDISTMIKDTKKLLASNVEILEQIQKVLDVTYGLDSTVDSMGYATCDSVTYLLNQTESLLDYLTANITALNSLSTNITNVVGGAIQQNPTKYGTTYASLVPTYGQTSAAVMTVILVNAQSNAAYPTYYSALVAQGYPSSTAAFAAALMVNGWDAQKLAAYQANPSSYTTELALIAVKNIYANDSNMKASAGSVLQTYQILQNIRTRSSQIEEQYYKLSSYPSNDSSHTTHKGSTGTLENALTSAGNLIDDITSSTAGTSSMNVLFYKINNDLVDTVDSLNTISNLGSSSSSMTAEEQATMITESKEKITSTKEEIALMRKAFKTMDIDTTDLDTDDMVKVLNELIDNLDEMNNVLDEAQTLLESTGDAADLLAEAGALATTTQNYINDTLWPTLESTFNDIEEIMDDVSELLIHTASTLNGSGEVIDATNLSLMGINNSLYAVQDLLDLLASRIEPLMEDIDNIQTSEVIEDLRTLLGLDPDATAEFFAEPVDVTTESVYEVENYGSGMAPFYTSLAIWIGNIIIAALFKTGADPSKLKDPKPWEMFFGRYGLFLTFNEVQAVIILLGDLFLLKIQCVHPVMFVLTGMLAAFAFSVFIYAMTLAFGIVGKAAAVLLFIMQIAGSGGTYPVQLLPLTFQAIYKFLPFNWSIGAMRACIAGTYGYDYWINMGVLMIYAITAIVFGLRALGFRRMTDYTSKQMEDSHILH